jgi:hypothetical protein
MDIGGMLATTVTSYLENNPEFKAQLDDARAALFEFLDNSRAQGAALARIEASVLRIEAHVSGAANLQDDALLAVAGAIAHDTIGGVTHG